MSVLHSSESGWLISHSDFINNIYKQVHIENKVKSYKISDDLFKIIYPYKKPRNQSTKKRKLEETDNLKVLQECVNHVQKLYPAFQEEIKNFLQPTPCSEDVNDLVLELSRRVYDETGKASICDANGENKDHSKLLAINSSNFLFPPNSKFYCRNVLDIERYLIDIKYDVIVLDPPWWNKYVRRKKAKTDHGYKMMYNNDLQAIPIEKLLCDTGLVVVWCTNSLQNLQALQYVIFRKWKVHFVAKLYWLKITQSGEPVCDFATPPNKQPFEQILVASRNPQHKFKSENNKLIVSVPSGLHSHKPPLLEILKPYLPANPNCLELFARYLLPNWSSWGLEALRFQHESLYQTCE